MEQDWCLLVGILQRQRLCWVYCGDADMQNQLNGIIRNKAIYQKVAIAWLSEAKVARGNSAE